MTRFIIQVRGSSSNKSEFGGTYFMIFYNINDDIFPIVDFQF